MGQDEEKRGEKSVNSATSIRQVKLESADFTLHNSRGINLRPVPSSDPNDPLNWPKWRKLYNMTIVSLYTLMCYALLCVAVPSWTTMSKDLGFSFNEFNNSYALSLGTTGIGCILFIPLTIDYGRRPIYIVSGFGMILFCAWSAKMNSVWELYVTQAIQGLVTSTAEIIVQMTISDMFFVHERASMNGMYLVFCYLGNNMAQVAGGYVTLSQGWRWNYWWCLILMAGLQLLILFTFEETKYVRNNPARPTSIAFDKLQAMSVTNAIEPNNDSKTPWIDFTIPKRTYLQKMALYTKTEAPEKSTWRKWLGPCIIIFKFPLVLFVAVQYGFSVAWTSIMSTTASLYLGKDPYNFSSAAIGNINISPFVGTVIGTIIGGILCDWSVVQLSKWNNGLFKPEYRLYSAILPSLAIIGSLFMYGYGFHNHDAWIVPVFAYGMASFGGTALSDSILTYLMDSYREMIGQSMIGVVVVQNIIPMALVFGIKPWNDAIGIDKVMCICGGLSIAALLTIFPMIKYGKKVRQRSEGPYEEFLRNFTREARLA
ncbi:hypothetical protein TRICI_000496 [Trichomonascus ciferrii]|uniref:Major facilitator superfamily (MFS) profile domain-containing protein n=1 Tax=Trichomonascus ciferrii TaxID=44093 RepID=A0A642VD76_9ASCO|nr:hypothetical protein TRICI_000496 [Trichomonascus ciferrii]